MTAAKLFLDCPVCAHAGESGTVPVSLQTQHWTNPKSNAKREFVTGMCGSCGSVVLLDPSPKAVELVAGRVMARG